MSSARKRRQPAARGRRNPAEPVKLEIAVRSVLWRKQRTAQSVVRKAVLAAAKAASTAPAELAIVLSHDSAIKALNRDWRGKNVATNVLSFPAAPTSPAAKGGKSARPTPYIGDIVIA